MNRIGWLLLLGVAPWLCPAQVATITLERQQWSTQSLSNSVPLNYRVQSYVIGAGLQQVLLSSPGASNALSGTAVQMSFLTNFPAITMANNTVISGLTQLNTSFPTGTYRFVAETATTNPITKKVIFSTNTYSVNLTNDFPPGPLVTNLVPLASLDATQTFSWTPLASATESGFVAFYLFEGEFDTNLLASIASSGAGALSNLTLMASFPSLPITTASVTVSNLNPQLDHLAAIEFYAETKTTTQPVPVVQAGSSSWNFVFYLGGLETNEVTLEITNSTSGIVITWPTNGTSQLSLTATTNLTPTGAASPARAVIHGALSGPAWERVSTKVEVNQQGRFQVVIPAEAPRRFFRLE